MKDQATSRRRWRIGELAEATGLTVRTLHHYEHIGLLAAAARSEGRQRLYDEDDVRRLYRIRALRDLGLSLADIRRTLKNDRAALGDVLRRLDPPKDLAGWTPALMRYLNQALASLPEK